MTAQGIGGLINRIRGRNLLCTKKQRILYTFFMAFVVASIHTRPCSGDHVANHDEKQWCFRKILSVRSAAVRTFNAY